MAAITISPQNVTDILAGRNTVVDGNGKQYLVSKGLLYYAYTQFQAGGDITVLAPTWVNNTVGLMEEIVIKR